MKTFTPLILMAVLCLLPSLVSGQKKEIDDSYRRSSLCMILVDEAKLPQRDLIKETFLYAPIPDKFNDHNIDVQLRLFDPSYITITEADEQAYLDAAQAALDSQTPEGKKPKKARTGPGFGGMMKSIGSTAMKMATGMDQSAMMEDVNLKEYAIKSLKYLNNERIAKGLFDKWFLNDEGDFSMDLVGERGLYGASMMDVQTALNSVRGMGLLADAGEELIKNTFVVVSRFRYIDKNELAKEIDAATAESGSKPSADSDPNILLRSIIGDGYYVRATSFLFQLQWNEEISNTFYSQLWGNRYAYDNADIFQLTYIGQETAFANVQQSVFTKSRPIEELVQIATINASDAVLAKLQKKYDVFKTKTPLLSVEPQLTAQIGMKEGVEVGDRFEVLEREVDPETNKTVYRRKGTIKAVQVWDNRYMADVLTGEETDTSINATVFEGSTGGLYPGMLIRQIK